LSILLSMKAPTFRAKQWHRLGDHPKVRAATASEAPFSKNPERYGWLVTGPQSGQLVIPGDYILSDAEGALSVVTEKNYRKLYAPLAG